MSMEELQALSNPAVMAMAMDNPVIANSINFLMAAAERGRTGNYTPGGADDPYFDPWLRNRYSRDLAKKMKRDAKEKAAAEKAAKLAAAPKQVTLSAFTKKKAR